MKLKPSPCCLAVIVFQLNPPQSIPEEKTVISNSVVYLRQPTAVLSPLLGQQEDPLFPQIPVCPLAYLLSEF